MTKAGDRVRMDYAENDKSGCVLPGIKAVAELYVILNEVKNLGWPVIKILRWCSG